MLKSVLGTIVACAGLALASGPALAECDSQQEKLVGRAIAETVAPDVQGMVGEAQRQIVDLNRCEGGSRHFETKFKFTVKDANGKTVWIEGMARGTDATIEDIHYSKASPELKALVGGALVATR